MNDPLAHRVIREALRKGVTEFCICAGSRNSPFVIALDKCPDIKLYYWFEERSAAFFALGRSKATERPVAVITTSGTAAAELLPATMEAYYTGIPLLLITADRPRRFRGTGAPQTAEQVGLFGCYAPMAVDIALDDPFDLSPWTCQQPAHLNVCFEEPSRTGLLFTIDSSCDDPPTLVDTTITHVDLIERFLLQVERPLVVVSNLKKEAKESVCAFLQQLNAPVFAEGISGLREDPRLDHLRITSPEKVLQTAAQAGYPIDGVMRIGGVPTNRLWRDLEEQEGKIAVCSISEWPFSGLSWGGISHGQLAPFFADYRPPRSFKLEASQGWLEADRLFSEKVHVLFAEEPKAEASLIHTLSKRIPKQSSIYLGNSLPIREWDLAASYEDRRYHVTASRGVNGIDGQISTFLGYSRPNTSNWALLGDLTALYDMAGPWILSQLPDVNVNIVIINNGGGQIFSRMFKSEVFLNKHNLNFSSLAALWNMHYERWTAIPDNVESKKNRIIEIVPDEAATTRFWKKLSG